MHVGVARTRICGPCGRGGMTAWCACAVSRDVAWVARARARGTCSSLASCASFRLRGDSSLPSERCPASGGRPLECPRPVPPPPIISPPPPLLAGAPPPVSIALDVSIAPLMCEPPARCRSSWKEESLLECAVSRANCGDGGAAGCAHGGSFSGRARRCRWRGVPGGRMRGYALRQTGVARREARRVSRGAPAT